MDEKIKILQEIDLLRREPSRLKDFQHSLKFPVEILKKDWKNYNLIERIVFLVIMSPLLHVLLSVINALLS